MRLLFCIRTCSISVSFCSTSFNFWTIWKMMKKHNHPIACNTIKWRTRHPAVWAQWYHKFKKRTNVPERTQIGIIVMMTFSGKYIIIIYLVMRNVVDSFLLPGCMFRWLGAARLRRAGTPWQVLRYGEVASGNTVYTDCGDTVVELATILIFSHYILRCGYREVDWFQRWISHLLSKEGVFSILYFVMIRTSSPACVPEIIPTRESTIEL